MADDWQPGDLALCVKVDEGHGARKYIRVGGVYTVTAIAPFRDCFGEVGLSLDGIHPVATSEYLPFFAASRFRKINPLTDAEREEALRDLKAPVREPAA